MTNVTYRNFSVLIRHVGFIEVRACSYEAMLADIEAAYANAEVITWSVR
jgi:hypothetical protein